MVQPERKRRKRHQQGVALIGAIAMLMLFSLLGVAYIGFMTIELDATRFEVRKLRSESLAIGGVNAAIGEIAAALAANRAPAEEYTFNIPVYRREQGPELVPYEQDIRVAVVDESGLANLNHLPPDVLERLGLDSSAVQQLKSVLPAPGDRPDGRRRWLASVDELRTRGILGPQAFRDLNRDLFTVYSAADPNDPAGYLNVNAAPPEVLAAILNTNIDEAHRLVAQRPFTSWQDLVTKSGRDPQTYNVRPPFGTPRDMPEPLTLESRCFRIVCRAMVLPRNERKLSTRRAVEAVVLFNEDGSHEIRYWSRFPAEQFAALDEVDARQASGSEEAGEETDPPSEPVDESEAE